MLNPIRPSPTNPSFIKPLLVLAGVGELEPRPLQLPTPDSRLPLAADQQRLALRFYGRHQLVERLREQPHSVLLQLQRHRVEIDAGLGQRLERLLRSLDVSLDRQLSRAVI